MKIEKNSIYDSYLFIPEYPAFGIRDKCIKAGQDMDETLKS